MDLRSYVQPDLMVRGAAGPVVAQPSGSCAINLAALEARLIVADVDRLLVGGPGSVGIALLSRLPPARRSR
jgi:hypothetical protein